MRVLRGGAVAAALVLTLGFGASACGKSGSSTTATTVTSGSSVPAGAATTGAPAAGANAIKISGFKFVPDPATGKVGATITVTNMDGTDHSFTADDGSFDTGIFSSGSKTITVAKAGTFKVHCRIHNFMTGTITVS